MAVGMNQVYMVVGCPGAGKSWVCNQLTRQYEYVPHDTYKDSNAYIAAIVRQSKIATKPLLIETPFSISQLKEPLEKHDYRVTPVFIIEDPKTVRDRYRARESKPIPEGHLTRQIIYEARAIEWNAYRGTSAAVLAFLQAAVPQQPRFPWDPVE
jgi:hypothetical protein